MQATKELNIHKKLNNEVIKPGICVNCGLCSALDKSKTTTMEFTAKGPRPIFTKQTLLPKLAWDACPGKGINYIELYKAHYKKLPNNWLLGHAKNVRVGYSSNKHIRNHSSSGGIITSVLIELLNQNIVDAIIIAKTTAKNPVNAKPYITDNPDDIISCAQSIYTPVAMLEIISKLKPGMRYAMTCTPEQSAALRFLQSQSHPQALQIHFALGPYTGTAMYPKAIECFLKSKKIKKNEYLTNLKWRDGEWPGHLTLTLNSGKKITSPKFYYNYLIPFFITQTSLQSMDFTNEFCDLSVGDAWSPEYEKQGKGFCVFTTRNNFLEHFVTKMINDKKIEATIIDQNESLNMHGHMLDFKKRGSHIRNKIRQFLNLKAPNYGITPCPITPSRVCTEVVIITIFSLCKTRIAQWIMSLIPEKYIGPLFNTLRKTWKNLSKPTKRKGLSSLVIKPIRNNKNEE